MDEQEAELMWWRLRQARLPYWTGRLRVPSVERSSLCVMSDWPQAMYPPRNATRKVSNEGGLGKTTRILHSQPRFGVPAGDAGLFTHEKTQTSAALFCTLSFAFGCVEHRHNGQQTGMCANIWWASKVLGLPLSAFYQAVVYLLVHVGLTKQKISLLKPSWSLGICSSCSASRAREKSMLAALWGLVFALTWHVKKYTPGQVENLISSALTE